MQQPTPATLFALKRRPAPYVSRISAQAIHAQIERRARREALREQLRLTARNAAELTARAWRAAAPWVAATAIATAVGFAQIADDAAKQAATYRNQRDALIAVNQPLASITMQASSLGALATTAHHMAAALDAETGGPPITKTTKRLRGAGEQ